MARTIKLKTNSATHKEAVRLVADTLNARSYANRAIGDGIATPGMRAAFGAEIVRKSAAAQSSLKAARAEEKAARQARENRAKSDAITARYSKMATTYTYYSNLQLGSM